MREIQIYVVKDGQKSGPFTDEQIKLMLDRSEVSLSTLAWADGHQKWEPLHIILGIRPPESAVRINGGSSASGTNPTPAYFYISTPRLICMTVFSLGIFANYWVYKNWRFIKERDGLDIMPFWRGWFIIFNFYPLLKYIKEDPKVSHPEKPGYSCGWLTFGLFAFTCLGNLLIPAMLSFLFILPAHNYISRINRAADTPVNYSPWSFGQILCLLFIPILLALIIR